jgi:hypothetical protein
MAELTTSMAIGRPDASEHIPYYGQYIDLVPEGDILSLLEGQIEETVRLFEAIPADRLHLRPAPREWSPMDIAIHVADGERIFAYRAFWIARSVGTEMPGFEPDPVAEAANANRLSREDAVHHLRTVRAASLSLLRNLAPEDWSKSGVASGNPITVRALAYLTAGHMYHHDADFVRAASS